MKRLLHMNYKFTLNRCQLKYLVIAAMLIDHIAWAFLPLDAPLAQVLHLIGRLTGPTMAYFAAEGYCHTRSFSRYAARLGIFALISWAPFVFFELGTLPITIENGVLQVQPMFGVLHTILLGLLAVRLWDSTLPAACKVIGVILLCILALPGDWLFFNVLYILYFYIFREDNRRKWTAFCIITTAHCLLHLLLLPWQECIYNLGIFLVMPLIHFCYSGEPGSRAPVHKWFFYLFYPAHLLVLGILKWMIFK